ncbi:hypothetical protein PIB30_097869 [Stylosanthes scabra]|uniref:Uncharacterized protein n=1 Tax=Stylosanthes scabra TaxID=79078 RepID=A0ABU6XWN3_9FABA|nr:hypothetical protein [Stylosanthes scabra]
MERIGVRRAERYERGKHGEVFGYVGRSNKGECVGGFVSGVRRGFRNWGGPQKQSGHSVFVDNLSSNGAVKAVEMMNDAPWNECKLYVTMSGDRREGVKRWRAQRNGEQKD